MTELHGLSQERLMEHMRAICKGIGARPACSEQELRAAQYVQIALRSVGVEQIEVQPFRSHTSSGAQAIPVLATAAAGSLVAQRGRLGKLLGAGLTLWAGSALRDVMNAKPPFFQPVIATGKSQNVIAVIPPTDEVRQRVTLVGHLDTNKQRFTLPPDMPELLKPYTSLGILMLFWHSLVLLRRVLKRKPRIGLWDLLVFGTTVGSLLLQIRDEQEPYIEGANDNATAISVLLGLAETLQAQPLKHTEVTLLFTGCEEVGSIGMLHYLEKYQPPRFNHYFIDYEMVGTGNICYVTEHGVSYFSEYTPDLELLEIAHCAAEKQPNVAARAMLIVEEVATLRRLGYKALCIAGYNQEGRLPNWHRMTDRLENIQPGTLSRAAHFGWQMLQEIDAR